MSLIHDVERLEAAKISQIQLIEEMGGVIPDGVLIDGFADIFRELFTKVPASTTTEFGYINSGGEFQPLDLSGDAPADSGDPQTAELSLFDTGYSEPEYPASTVSGPVLYKCTEVNTELGTWKGERLNRTQLGYELSGEITDGLVYGSIVPEIGFVYSGDAFIKVETVQWATSEDLIGEYSAAAVASAQSAAADEEVVAAYRESAVAYADGIDEIIG